MDLNKAGLIPLQMALKERNKNMVETLIKTGARIVITNEECKTCLAEIIECGDTDLMELILSNPSNFCLPLDSTLTGKDGKEYPLEHIAAMNNQAKILELLLHQGYSIESTTTEGFKPLHFACLKGLPDIVDLCVKWGADLNGLTKDGISPAMFAICSNHAGIVNYLLGQGAEVDAEDNSGRTLLYHAVINGDLEVLKAVLEGSPSLHHKGNYEAFKTAISEQSLAIVQALLCYGFTYTEDIVNDGELLLNAIYNGFIEIVRELLRRGANSNYVSRYRKFQNLSPLRTCLMYDNLQIAKLLIEAGVNINARFEVGRTLLFEAIGSNHIQFIEFLLKHGADVNILDDRGITPILYAAEALDFGDSIKMILEYGPNIDAQNKRGKTLLHFAVKSRRPENVILVLKYCPNAQMIQYQDLLFKTIFGGAHYYRGEYDVLKNKIMECLLDYGFNATEEQVRNKAFLTEAVSKGFVKLVQYLLDRGADPNILSYGRPLFSVACTKGLTKIASLLMHYGANLKGCEICFEDAIRDDNIELLQLLMKTAIPRNFQKLVYDAVVFSSPKILCYLIEFEHPNFNVNSIINGLTLAQYAAKRWCPNVVEVLWKYGADLDQWGEAEEFRETALHTACRLGGANMIQELLRFGADVNATSATGLGVVDFMIERQDWFEEHECIRQHIAALYSAGMYVSDVCLAFMLDGGNEAITEPFNKEICLMKNTKLSNSHISYYQILISSTNEMARYAKNPLIVEALRTDSYLQQFPNFSSFLENKIRCGFVKRTLLDDLTKKISSGEYFLRLPWHCVDYILSFLTIEDLFIANGHCQCREWFDIIKEEDPFYYNYHPNWKPSEEDTPKPEYDIHCLFDDS